MGSQGQGHYWGGLPKHRHRCHDVEQWYTGEVRSSAIVQDHKMLLQTSQIRVYFFSKDHHLVEVCFSSRALDYRRYNPILCYQRCYEGGAAGAWTDGFLSKSNVAAAPTSTVAVLLSPGPHLEGHYQGTDGSIWQATNSSATAWSAKKINVPAIPLGSSIAATFLADGKKRRINTTNTQDHLFELVSSTGNEWVQVRTASF